jgi:predicted small secreted protein
VNNDEQSPDQNPTIQSTNIMKQSLKCAIYSLCLLALILAGVGCRNTAEGVGEDMESTGEKIQEKTD